MRVYKALEIITNGIHEHVDSLLTGEPNQIIDTLAESARGRMDEEIDSLFTWYSDVHKFWDELGWPDPEDAVETTAIFTLIEQAVREKFYERIDPEDIVREYVEGRGVWCCEDCSVAIINDDYSSEDLMVTPETVSEFRREHSPVHLGNFEGESHDCELCCAAACTVFVVGE